VPEISRFYGLVIRMYFEDHPPPHFHAHYGEHEALVSIQTMAVIGGRLPPRALGLVIEWTLLHQEELELAWAKARNLEPLPAIAPLP
jgi:hypothetical protein